jgi:hypothetical protein
MAHLYLLKKVFPKFDPLTAPGMALCVHLGLNVKINSAESQTKQNRVLLSLRLWGVKFRLVSHKEESNSAYLRRVFV